MPHLCRVDFRQAQGISQSLIPLHYFAFHYMRGRVEIPGCNVCIPVLFSSQFLGRESRTRTLFSTPTGYHKELQLLWYKELINPSRHHGHSTMINFDLLTLLPNHVWRTLNDGIDHVLELQSWDFLCSQNLVAPTAHNRAQPHSSNLDNKHCYDCQRCYSLLQNIISQDLIQDRLECPGCHLK